MSWNYRVVRRRFLFEEQYEIHEVYYDETGKPNGLTECGVSPGGSSLEEFNQSLLKYLEATQKPVLDYDTLKEINDQSNEQTQP